MTPAERDVVTFIEQYYLLNGSFPEISAINLGTLIPELTVASMLQTNDIKDALERRGITRLGASPGQTLSESQLECANLMLDFTDGRSEKKKLDFLGVSSAKYQSWLRNPVFKNYLQNRAESMLNDNMHTAHTALLDSVRSGDTQALKLYYEITGRHSSKTVGEMNIQFFMAKVLEAIQRHVDPSQYQAIAAEFSVLADITQPKEIVNAYADRAS